MRMFRKATGRGLCRLDFVTFWQRSIIPSRKESTVLYGRQVGLVWSTQGVYAS